MLRKSTLLFLFLSLLLPSYLFAATPVNRMVVFGDSLSDTGNTYHLLKSLRQEEDPGFLVRPLKVFIINKMNDYANQYHVPQMVLDKGVAIANHFFENELGPFVVSLVIKVNKVPLIPTDPYWQARFSNGPVWSEYLAPMLNVDTTNNQVFSDQAFGGSWAVTYDYQLTVWNLIRHPINTIKNLVIGKLIPPSLGIVVQAYLLMHPQLDDEAVYFVFVGANDYLRVLSFEDNYNPAIMSDYIDNVLSGIQAGVQQLVKAGAKKVVILGLPNMGLIPRYQSTTDSAVLTSALTLHNERLARLINEWQQNFPEVDFLHIASQPLLEKALADPAHYGFSNTTQACIDVKFPDYRVLSWSPFATNPVLLQAQLLEYRDPSFAPGERNFYACDNPQSYIFWDEIHPTTKTHSYLAYEVCLAMKAHGYEANCKSPS